MPLFWWSGFQQQLFTAQPSSLMSFEPQDCLEEAGAAHWLAFGGTGGLEPWKHQG